jgi:hypothetical protein
LVRGQQHSSGGGCQGMNSKPRRLVAMATEQQPASSPDMQSSRTNWTQHADWMKPRTQRTNNFPSVTIQSSVSNVSTAWFDINIAVTCWTLFLTLLSVRQVNEFWAET